MCECAHLCVCVCVRVDVCVCVRVCVYVYVQVRMCTCTCTCTCTCMCMCGCMWVCVGERVRVCVRLSVYVYVCMYVCIFTERQTQSDDDTSGKDSSDLIASLRESITEKTSPILRQRPLLRTPRHRRQKTRRCCKQALLWIMQALPVWDILK